jgi:hypothetical protein
VPSLGQLLIERLRRAEISPAGYGIVADVVAICCGEAVGLLHKRGHGWTIPDVLQDAADELRKVSTDHGELRAETEG